ncbi:MAG: transposase zinc-binding domain-containing protein, partial [Verrucomicrobia bacterium]|nr:transposase zinc-binding domain-containing protein [Verrucomicrobiota bacterium]
MCTSYRPRQAKASPLWQCLKSSLDDFFQVYSTQYQPTLGPLRPELEEAFNRFLRCGDLTHGFLRVRCGHCDHEYLLPFTCKQRGICPTCHQRRTVDTAQTI